ncbi:MAG: flagellar filament capping protein FliD [Phycisphaerae bacterium]|nr:flagellar filament capping protein FliD [Phycisphaerae bacterium]
MASIQLGGLFSGIDTQTLVSQLIAAEQGTIKRYQTRQQTLSTRETALNDLQTKLQSLKTATAAISDASTLRAFTAASSDTDILTAEVSNSAFEGNHAIVINQLASPERWVHTAGQEYAQDPVGAGTFIYSYNHQETTITTTADTTLEDLVGLINNDANNPGVTANLLFYNNSYHLMLNGNDAGSDYAISVNANDTEVSEAASSFTTGTANAELTDAISGLSQLDGTLVGGEYITISGKTHDGTAVSQNLMLYSTTKLSQLIQEINTAFNGTATATLVNGQIRLTDATCGPSQMELSLTYNAGTGSTTFDTPAIPSSNREVWQAASSFTATAGGANGELTDAIVDLNEFDDTFGTLMGDESITISGKKHDGTAASQSLSVTGSTKLSDLIQKINDAFGGTATATLENGKIRLTDHTSGTSQMELSLTYNPGSGSTTLDIPAISESVQGETITADLAGFAAADFTKTQSAQDSQIKVDGYPLGADEWITRSSNTIDNVVTGVTLHLHDTGSVQLDLTRDTTSIKTKVNSIVSAYNAAITLYEEKTGYDVASKTAGVLMGDSVVSDAADDLHMLLIQQASGFATALDSFVIPGQIGLDLDKDGKLSLTAGTFDQAIAEDYAGVLAIIGADKTGNSDSNTIKFYGASGDNTTAGTYNVQVTISGGIITSAKIKTEGETTYRDATNQGNTILGNSTFSENGDPLYPENGLQLSIDRSQDGTFTATVRVQQGFAGAMSDALDRMLDATTGVLTVDRKGIDDQIQHLQDQIKVEQDRLTQKQKALTARFARLEKTLTLIQNQMAALGVTTTSTSK